MKNIKWFVLLAVVAVSSTAFGRDWGKHEHLQHATNHIDEAKRSLKDANDHEKSEFGGHRGKAEALLTQAQSEIEAAAEWADAHKGQ